MLFTACLLVLISLNNAAEPVPPEFKNQPSAKGLELTNGLQCPSGTFQWGLKWQDIMNCGMDHCMNNRRFGKTMEQCRDYCISRSMEGGTNSQGQGMGCAVFSWAPVGGDMNHPLQTVCTLHDRTDMAINEDHGPNQIMCALGEQGPCPVGTWQYGGKKEDIKDCGMDHCGNIKRFNKPNKEACRDYCRQKGCFVFSWAEVGGDMNHPLDTVCTLHKWNDRWINEDHGPDQVLCRNGQIRPNDKQVYYAPGFPRAALHALIEDNATGFAAIGMLGLVSLIGGITLYKRKQRATNYEIPAESANLL